MEADTPVAALVRATAVVHPERVQQAHKPLRLPRLSERRNDVLPSGVVADRPVRRDCDQQPNLVIGQVDAGSVKDSDPGDLPGRMPLLRRRLGELPALGDDGHAVPWCGRVLVAAPLVGDEVPAVRLLHHCGRLHHAQFPVVPLGDGLAFVVPELDPARFGEHFRMRWQAFAFC